MKVVERRPAMEGKRVALLNSALPLQRGRRNLPGDRRLQVIGVDLAPLSRTVGFHC